MIAAMSQMSRSQSAQVVLSQAAQWRHQIFAQLIEALSRRALRHVVHAASPEAVCLTWLAAVHPFLKNRCAASSASAVLEVLQGTPEPDTSSGPYLDTQGCG